MSFMPRQFLCNLYRLCGGTEGNRLTAIYRDITALIRRGRRNTDTCSLIASPAA
ncbi:hypothetical protein KCP77_14260 [Salmonella enterica subsp. enterica]|nr:hypothetical protein KCP77_14260 [Salmonella enterica subsp. enterica]